MKVEFSSTGLVWQDSNARWVSKDKILGEFASLAIRQSPYLFPENLTEAVVALDGALPWFTEDDYQKLSVDELEKGLYVIFEATPSILAWNSPKKGNHTMVFTSRYGGPEPDYDFMDLCALARNIAHSIWISLLYDDALDGKRVLNSARTEGLEKCDG